MPPLRPIPPALLVLWLATASAAAEPSRAVESFGDRTVTVVRGGASPPAPTGASAGPLVPPRFSAPVGLPYATSAPYPPPLVYGAPSAAGFPYGYGRGDVIVVVPDGRRRERRGYRLPRGRRGAAGAASPIVPQFAPGPMPAFR